MDWPQVLAADAARAVSRAQLLDHALGRARTILRARFGAALQIEPRPTAVVAQFGIRGTHMDEYVKYWRPHDATLRAALAHRVPACSNHLERPSTLTERSLCADFGRRVSCGSYMVIPIYAPNGEVTVTIHLCRPLEGETFTPGELQEANAFSGFLSTMLATVSERRSEPHVALAPRELQVARLAVQGLSNPQIAHELGLARQTVKRTLSRVYEKTESVNRVQLSALGFRLGWLE